MPEPIWIWDERVNQYRDTATGRFIGVEQMMFRREEFMDGQKALLNEYTDKYYNNEIYFEDFRTIFKNTIKDTIIDMYAMGAGGRNSMSQADWGRVGAIVKDQYQYMRVLFDKLGKKEITIGQFKARLNMYINSANEALWRGINSNYEFKLPAYPGDGSTQCLVNCKCYWEIIAVAGGYDCYWRLEQAEHCEDCIQRSNEWNPWRWRKTEGGNA